MTEGALGFPLWVLIFDYAVGAIMWTLIGRAALGLFLPQDSSWGFWRIICAATDPLLRLFKPLTPGFLIPALIPLFVAWFFYMVRFYVMPPLLGYGVMGTLSFPLESSIAQFLYRIAG